GGRTNTSSRAAGGPAASVDELAGAVVQLLNLDEAGDPICSGSGSVVDASGLILTNAHVVGNEGECAYASLGVAITTSTDEPPELQYLADVVAFSPALDLAVVQIRSDLEGEPVEVDLPTIRLGDSDDIGLGDEIRVLGYPGIGGDTITLTSGSVSGFVSQAGVGGRAWVKTDATVAGGNSGGTAINASGELIGVPTQASPGDGAEVADCRFVEDTNGDNSIDELDSCIPIGGFINGLRPVNLALDLLDEGRRGIAVDATTSTPGPAATDDASFGTISFTDHTVEDSSGAPVRELPSGADTLCGSWSYSGMVDGARWDAIWYRDGQVQQDQSFFGEEWIGGAEGDDWWVCALADDTSGLSDGLWELVLFVGDEFFTSNSIYVGSSFRLRPLEVINSTGQEICYLQLSPVSAQGWGADELDETETLLDGASAVVDVVLSEPHDVLARDCDLNVIAQLDQAPLAGGRLVLTR
ncbi:MAG: trypsin-like peptidase domain-containing protein, partial [Acidimicrobiia bacterium]|nr:trypsin-like peptidase domain-containing protein [Acidimicrobiia bacterium]